MRILSAMFDAALLPFDVIADVGDTMTANNMGGKSKTRERLEAIEDNLR
jgi:hypothetical protein